MTKRNSFNLVGKGSRNINNKLFSSLLLDYYLKECNLKVVIEDIYGEKFNVLVKGLSGEGNYQEDNVICRYKNATDMFNFLQGYYHCFKNLIK